MAQLNARRRVSLALLALPAMRAGQTLAAISAWAEIPVGTRVDLPRFSAALPGSRLPPGWSLRTLPSVERPNRFDLVADEGGTVLRVISDRSASSLTVALRVDPAATPLLNWRWRVSQAVAGSDLRRKAGDDYAARVYVLFDLPLHRLGIGDRMGIAAARLLHGAELPAAALCYVWGTGQSVGESGWNPYTDRLRMIVVDSDSGARWSATLLPIFVLRSANRCRWYPASLSLLIPITLAGASKPVLATCGSRPARKLVASASTPGNLRYNRLRTVLILFLPRARPGESLPCAMNR
jgi:hypothetical protein